MVALVRLQELFLSTVHKPIFYVTRISGCQFKLLVLAAPFSYPRLSTTGIQKVIFLRLLHYRGFELNEYRVLELFNESQETNFLILSNTVKRIYIYLNTLKWITLGIHRRCNL